MWKQGADGVGRDTFHANTSDVSLVIMCMYMCIHTYVGIRKVYVHTYNDRWEGKYSCGSKEPDGVGREIFHAKASYVSSDLCLLT